MGVRVPPCAQDNFDTQTNHHHLTMLFDISKYLSQSTAQLLLCIIGLAIFYLFILYPKIREENTRHHFIQNLQIGTPVITSGGIHGKVKRLVNTDKVIIETQPKGWEILLDKAALSKPIKT